VIDKNARQERERKRGSIGKSRAKKQRFDSTLAFSVDEDDEFLKLRTTSKRTSNERDRRSLGASNRVLRSHYVAQIVIFVRAAPRA